MTTKLLLLVSFIAIQASVFATDKIEGAFGMALGQKFDPEKAIGTSSLTDGTPMYQFNPEKPFRSFTKYFVMITPTSHQIYSIWGMGSSENTETAQKEQAVVIEILKQKYGEEEKQGLMDTISDIKQIIQGDRNVIVKVSGFTDVAIDIRYTDSKPEELAENERLALEAKKVDSSGL